jgi:hypothetical protein
MHMGRPPLATLKSLPVSVRLPSHVKSAAEVAAKEDTRSLSSYIEKLLTDHLKKEGYFGGLAGKAAPRPPSKEAAHKASKMADRELEPLGDKTLHPEERDRRKRALIHGPKEFRIRGDQPKKKGGVR